MVPSPPCCIGRRQVRPHIVWVILILLNIFVIYVVLRISENQMKKNQDYTQKTAQCPTIKPYNCNMASFNPRLREQSTSKPTNRPLEIRLKPTTKPIDMVNDYVPYVDFKLVYPEIMPTIKRHESIFLLVLVNSGAAGDIFLSRRNAIRKTWGSRGTCEQLRMSRDPELKDLKWMVVFVLGKSGPDNDKKNTEEAKEHNDVIIGDINDNYINNIVKFYMGQLWAVTLQPKFTMKTDDDVYVRIPGVLEYLVKQNISGPFYGGANYLKKPVLRTPGGKWSISRKYYAKDVYPTFNGGAFIVLSTDLHNRLFNYVHLRKPFHTDDAYLGVAMNDFNVSATHIQSFVVTYHMPTYLKRYTDCQIQAIVAFGHAFDLKSSNTLHNKLEKMCANNFAAQSCH